MNVKKRIRHLERYRKIAIALVRNGFGYLVHELGLPDPVSYMRNSEDQEIHVRTIGERVRRLLEELGPTFVKLGQIASTRPDLLPPDVIRELEHLQDQVPPFSYDEAVHIVEDELGERITDLFLAFDETPMASASIGQVHQAKLKDGTIVAVKVQRPRIAALIETDLEMLREFANLAEKRLEWARNYRLSDVIAELARSLLAELDYTAEARNGMKFAIQCQRMKHVKVPAIYDEYCTRRVLTMEFIEGIKLSEHHRLEVLGFDRTVLANRFASIIFHQILIEGFFHADPHPGNTLVQSDGSLALIDFGMVGRLTAEMKQHFAMLVIALRNQSSKGVLRAIDKMGIVPDDVDESRLRADVDDLRDKYYQVPLSKVSMGEAVNDLFTVAFRHRIRIPSELTLLGKTLLTMEGVVTALDPSFRVFDVAEPYGRRLFIEKFNPKNILQHWIEDLPDYWDLLTGVPTSLKNLSTLLQKGKLRIEITIPELSDILKKMDRISNRVTFSIVLLSLSIIMVGLIVGSSVGHKATMLWNFPVIEIGLGISTVIVLWLILAIFRSGRF